jgi:hypothetical protein
MKNPPLPPQKSDFAGERPGQTIPKKFTHGSLVD